MAVTLRTEMDYDFLIAPNDRPKTFAETPLPGPNLSQVAKMTPKKFAEDVLKVYNELGNTTWLLREAQADPATFMKLLVKLLPKQLDLGSLEGLTVRLIDQFGQTLEISSERSSMGPHPATGPAVLSPPSPPRPGQPDKGQIATGGSPEVILIDEFEDD